MNQYMKHMYFSKLQCDANLHSTKCRQMLHLKSMGKEKSHVEACRSEVKMCKTSEMQKQNIFSLFVVGLFGFFLVLASVIDL